MKRSLRTLLALGFLMAAHQVRVAAADDPDPRVVDVEARRIAAIDQASAATVAVFANAGAGGGSAVVITPDGYALSNFHVAKPAGNAMKCGLPDGRLYDAVIVSVDPTGDVALIRLLGRTDFPHAVLGDSDELRVGDWCFAAGNPFLLANDYTPSISYGVVSGVHRYQYPAGTLLEYADCIQTDAAINPGNSGGPLFNSRGELIGINGRGSFEKRGRVNVGVGYAISINQIKNFLGTLHSGRIVDHASLGATVITDSEGRVVVDNILEDSDAYRRGLRYDDEIVRFGGREIQTVNGFKNVLGIYPRDWRVPVTYRRNGKTFECLVRLAGLHRKAELEEAVNGPAGGHPEIPAPEDKPKSEKPNPEKPGPEDKPEKKGPRQLPVKKIGPAKMPEIVAAQFETRSGYVNYYFNKLNRDRVWKALVARGDFASAAPEWTMEGELEGGGPATVRISPTLGVITLPAGESKAQFGDSLRDNLNPPGSGGLLAALHVWQRLLLTGPEKFGEVFYLGTMPIPNYDGLVDVLAGIYGGVESRFFFDPRDGRLVGVEMWSDDDVDPAEVYFSDYREVEGRPLPHRLLVRSGDRDFAVIQVKQYRLETPAKPAE